MMLVCLHSLLIFSFINILVQYILPILLEYLKYLFMLNNNLLNMCMHFSVFSNDKPLANLNDSLMILLHKNKQF